MIYRIVEITTGIEILKYCASQIVPVINGVDYPLDAYEHLDEEASIGPRSTVFSGRRILTKLEFRSLFPESALKWIDRLEAQFESYEYLTAEQKDSIRTAFYNYHAATDVNLDDPRWVPGLGFYVALGGMSQEEVMEVLNG